MPVLFSSKIYGIPFDTGNQSVASERQEKDLEIWRNKPLVLQALTTLSTKKSNVTPSTPGLETGPKKSWAALLKPTTSSLKAGETQAVVTAAPAATTTLVETPKGKPTLVKW